MVMADDDDGGDRGWAFKASFFCYILPSPRWMNRRGRRGDVECYYYCGYFLFIICGRCWPGEILSDCANDEPAAWRGWVSEYLNK